jgi:class 3 adenylate cyclase
LQVPEYTPIGHTINLASRLQTVARAGSHCKTFIADFDYRTARAREIVVLNGWRGD